MAMMCYATADVQVMVMGQTRQRGSMWRGLIERVKANFKGADLDLQPAIEISDADLLRVLPQAH